MLQDRQALQPGELGWLDVCCGSGKALLEALQIAESNPDIEGALSITGIDLELHRSTSRHRPLRYADMTLLVDFSANDRSRLLTYNA